MKQREEGFTTQQQTGIELRPAEAGDLGFAALVYLRAMGPSLRRVVGLDADQQAALLMAQWDIAEVRIIQAAGRDVGWVQLAPAPAATFVRNICIDPDYHRLGIGTVVMRRVIDEAARRGDAVTLGVAKGNPARRLYDRLGFRFTHADKQHDFMRRPADPRPEPEKCPSGRRRRKLPR